MPWGNDLEPQPSQDSIRITMHNVNCFPASPTAQHQQDLLEYFDTLNTSIHCVSEHNLNLKYACSSLQWKERFRFLPHHHTHGQSNQQTELRDKVLHGGTGIFSFGEAARRVLQCDNDFRNLGRWSSTLYQGKGQVKLRVVSGYRPNPDKTDTTRTVFSQQQKYLQDNGCPTTNPRLAFFQDLDTAMQKWLKAGDLIILYLDANSDVRTDEVTKWTRRWKLYDTHQAVHPGLDTEETCDKNMSSYPVDGVWASLAIQTLRCGYLPFRDIDNSDHRLLWVEINRNTAFGAPSNPEATKPPNRMQLDDPRVVRRFNKHAKAEALRLDLPKQSFSIQSDAQINPDNPTIPLRLAKCAKLNLQIKRYALKKCRKLKMGKYEFSDRWKLTQDLITLWKRTLTRLQGLPTSSKQIRRLQKATGVMNTYRVSWDFAVSALKAARTAHRLSKKHHESNRSSEQKKLVAAKAKDKRISEEAIDKQLNNIYKTKRVARRVRAVTGKKKTGALSFVSVGDRVEHRQDGIEHHCMKEGLSRFSQTNPTTFMQPPMLEEVGYLAEESTVEAILNGTYEPPSTAPDYVKYFCKFLAKDPQVPPVSPYIETKDYQAAWRKMRTYTSSSPYGLAFADHQAASQDKTLADMDSALATASLLSGAAPEHWKKFMNVLIHKRAGSSQVSKLRIIALFDSMFNFINKYLGRAMMKNAETYGQIPREAGGSRARHRAIESFLNKRLATDLLRITHHTGAICSNDAKSCYDRIVHSIATICMRRMGLSANMCKMMFGTLQQAEHHIRTAFGDSTQHYAAVEIPLQGVLQGNGAGPAIWVVVSITMLNYIKSKGFGLTIREPISHNVSRLTCFIFVDDCDLIHSSPGSTPFATLLQMQSMVDEWERVLWMTGGALVPEKSYWYLIEFKFEKDSWRYGSIADTPGDITVRDPSGEFITMLRKEVHLASETLGIQYAVNGNEQKQYEKMRFTAQQWAERIRARLLNSHESWFSLNNCVMKSIEYPLMATCLSEDQCNKVMSDLISAGLPAIYLNQTFPHAAVYGPKDMQGIGIQHIWHTQGMQNFWACLRHGTDNTITGSEIRSMLEYQLLELGLPDNLFSYDYKKFKILLTPSWLKSIWEYCATTKFRLEYPRPILLLQSQQDKLLLQLFVNQGYKGRSLERLALCIRFLKAPRLSDIVTGDGRNIRQKIWQGYIDSYTAHSLDWGRQAKPSTAAWKLWREALTTLLHPRHIPHRLLQHPLGLWHTAPSDTWHHWYSSYDDRIYLFEPDSQKYQVYSKGRLSHLSRHSHYQYLMDSDTKGPMAHRTTILFHTKHRIQHTGYRRTEQNHQPALSQTTHSLAAPVKWYQDTVNFPLDGLSRLSSSLRSGTAVAICDGSFKDSYGTAAFFIGDSLHDESPIQGAHSTPGHSTDQSPYRSEVGGLYGVVATVEEICRNNNITEGSLTVGCDCKSAIQTVFEDAWVDPSQPCYDLIHDIREMIEHSPLKWTARHIYAHQDKKIAYHRLDPWSQRNVDMDSCAKAFWNEQQSTRSFRTHRYHLSPMVWSLWYGNRRISQWDQKQLHSLVQGDKLKTHWVKRNKVPVELIHSIDWLNCGKAIRRLPLFRQLWLTKWNCGYVATGHVLKRFKPLAFSLCPHCQHPDEDTNHILQCPARKPQQKWTLILLQLDSWLHSVQTDPALRLILMNRLHANRLQSPLLPFPGLRQDAQRLLTAQDQIGWNSAVEGFLHSDWAVIQNHYYIWLKRRNTGERWASALIRKLLQISWDLWGIRKDAVNDPNSATSLAEHVRLDAAIQSQFETGYQHLPRPQQRWFIRSPAAWFVESLPNKRQWLDHVESARKRARREPSLTLTAERQLMRDYLT